MQFINLFLMYSILGYSLETLSSLITNPGFNSGYMLGTLICKSYDGDVQFGTHTKKVRRKYNVNISKIDKEAQKNLEGAVLELYNEKGTKIHSWKSTENAEKIELELGTYTIKETQAPENYESEGKDIVFTIDVYGNIYNELGEKIASSDVTFEKDYVEKTYTDHETSWNKAVIGTVEEDKTGIDWDAVNVNVQNDEYITQDGGKIVVESSEQNLTIPASETVNNKEINYEILSKKVETKGTNTEYIWDLLIRNTIIKYNADGKVEWAANIQGYKKNPTDLTLKHVIEVDGKYYIAAQTSSHVAYADKTQTANEQEIIDSGFENPGPPSFGIVRRNGKNRFFRFNRLLYRNIFRKNM